MDWYFDESIHELEKKLIFDAGPGYVGHQLMVPEAGNYRSLEWKDHGQMLLNGGAAGPNAGIWQMSNVCRHRQAIMLQGSQGCFLALCATVYGYQNTFAHYRPPARSSSLRLTSCNAARG